jgi:hypothetical protein
MTIQTANIEVDAGEARRLYRQYRKHVSFSTEIDDEIRKTYQAIAQGKVVIRALESIRLAGINDEKLPKLAIARATWKECHLTMQQSGSAVMSDRQWPKRSRMNRFDFPEGTFSGAAWRHNVVSQVPLVPVYLRPNKSLENYHILFEPEWRRAVPIDPILLRRIGRGDMWVVVAAWDLTPVEQAALSTRLQS